MNENNSDFIGAVDNGYAGQPVVNPRLDYQYRQSWLERRLTEGIKHPGNETYKIQWHRDLTTDALGPFVDDKATKEMVQSVSEFSITYQLFSNRTDHMGNKNLVVLWQVI